MNPTVTDPTLLAALCSGTVSNAEAVGMLGVDAGMLAVEKPSRETQTVDVSDGAVVLLELRVLPDDVPAGARLRRLLKFCGRDLHLKCVSVRPATPPEDRPCNR